LGKCCERFMGVIIDDPSLRDRIHVFKDRFHAGEVLSEMIRRNVRLEDAILFAIPAGGVPVAYEISKRLKLPMDLAVVRKIQIPWNPEAGFGAISWDGEIVLNEELIRLLGLSREEVQESIQRTKNIVLERFRMFRRGKPIPDLRGKIVIVVDDGIASGYTMLAALRSLKKRSPEKIIIAAPTASTNAIEILEGETDYIICPNIRGGATFAVADAYREWYDLTEEEVIKLLKKLEKDYET